MLLIPTLMQNPEEEMQLRTILKITTPSLNPFNEKLNVVTHWGINDCVIIF